MSQETALIKLAPTLKEFKAGDVTYYVEDSMSVERYKHFERLGIELGFTVDFATLFNKIRTGYDLMNAGRLADAAVNQYQIMEGLALLDEKRNIALYVATLFINTADEDRTQWSVAAAEQKLKAWNEARLEVDFFLLVALSKVSGYKKAFEDVSKLFSNQTKEVEPSE